MSNIFTEQEKNIITNSVIAAPTLDSDFRFVNQVPVKIKRLRDNAITPKYEHGDFDNSGMYLYAAAITFMKDGKFEEYAGGDIAPGETAIIKTGFAMAIPKGLELQVRPTSGNSLKTKLRIANSPGTVDASFRGEIGIIVENIGDTNITIHPGAKVAQGVICPVFHAILEEADDLDETSRAANGYGSRGTINKEDK